jgi:AmmeMemoRadiSam system protein A
MNLAQEYHDRLIELARGTIRAALGGAEFPAPPEDDLVLQQRAGCFVSLHRADDHRLRGCVGRLDAKLPLGEIVVAMSRGVLEDPRFLTDPVRFDELAELHIELSILSPLRAMGSPLDFDLLNEGIYLTHAGRSGCFLPQVARETQWDKEQLLTRLCAEKMGVSSVAWRHAETRAFSFTTLIIGPQPLG